MQSFFSQIMPWIQHYGAATIFLWLALGIIALPVPEESLLLLIGFLMAKEKLPILSTIIAAYAGTCCGITSSYVLGLLTSRWLKQGWGRYIGLSEKRLQKAHNWFEKFGKWTLCIGYFIPGVRHFTGYVAGTLKLYYRHFALFAYSGGIVWSSLFMSLGYFFYKPINSFIDTLHTHTISLLKFF